MKLTCDKTALADAISAAVRAVSSKSTYPALEGLLLTARDGELEISGYNLEIGITDTCEADVFQEGSAVINAKYFSEIVRRFPREPVSITIDETNTALLKCGFSEFTLVTMPAEEFPELPVVESDYAMSLDGDTLKSMISETVFSVSTSDHKPVLTGALFDVREDELRLAATDGNRLAVRREALGAGVSRGEYSFIVPADALREIEKLLKGGEESVSLKLSKKHIVMENGRTRLISRLLDGDFYKYENALQAVTESEVIVSVGDLSESLDRVSLLINEKMKNAVRCHFEDGMIKMTYISSVGKAYDECPAEGRVSPVEIGLSNRYLLDALRAIKDEKVTVAFNAPHAPVILRPVEGEKFFYMIAPVRLS